MGEIKPEYDYQDITDKVMGESEENLSQYSFEELQNMLAETQAKFHTAESDKTFQSVREAKDAPKKIASLEAEIKHRNDMAKAYGEQEKMQ